MDYFAPGRYVMADTDAQGARDPVSLVSQTNVMRERMEQSIGNPVGLIIIVVQEDQRKAAVGRIQRALDVFNGPIT